MEKVQTLIAGINCSYEDAIREASKGSKVIILHDTEPTKPAIELVNFSDDEAKEFYLWVDSISEGNVNFIANYI